MTEWSCREGYLQIDRRKVPLANFTIVASPAGGIAALIPEVTSDRYLPDVLNAAVERPLKEVTVVGRTGDELLTLEKAKIDKVTLRGGPGPLLKRGKEIFIESKQVKLVNIRIVGLSLKSIPCSPESIK